MSDQQPTSRRSGEGVVHQCTRLSVWETVVSDDAGVATLVTFSKCLDCRQITK